LGEQGERGLVEALAWVSANIRLPDGLETIQTYLAEAETLGRRLGQSARWELGMALWLKSLALTFTDQAQQAEACARESWSLFLDCGDRWNAGPLNTLGIMELRRKNYPAARQFFEQALECFSQSKDNGGIASSYTNLTQLMLDQGDLPAAIRYFRQGAKVWHAQGNRANVAQYLNTSTFICLTTLLEQNPEQHLEPLASLISVWSASETYSPQLNQPLTGEVLRHWWPEILKNMQENNIITLPPETRQTLENRLSSWLDELGQAAFYQAVLAGQSLSFFQALELLPEELTPIAA
jgi:tetratricopeptide (TPR) repeat protein